MEYISYGRYYCEYEEHTQLLYEGMSGGWWYNYGIKDLTQILKSLIERGFVTLESIKESIKRLTIAELKELLADTDVNLKNRKKDDLVMLAKDLISEEKLYAVGIPRRYALTDLGKEELVENASIIYMHNSDQKTGPWVNDENEKFDVWSINKLLENKDKADWESIVEKRKKELDDERKQEESLSHIKESDPEWYNRCIARDKQFEECKAAEEQYKKDKDINAYILFFENIWANGGLLFNGNHWAFRLADLYIEAKMYDKAIDFCNKIKDDYPTYNYRANTLIERIEKLKNK